MRRSDVNGNGFVFCSMADSDMSINSAELARHVLRTLINNLHGCELQRVSMTVYQNSGYSR
jgi:hypothetical protein